MTYPLKKVYWVEKSKNYSGLKLLAPISGQITAITDQYPHLDSGAVGEGIIIQLTSNKLFAPCHGEIVQISPCGHRLLLKASNGLKIALEFPPENQQLMGVGFTSHFKSGDKFNAGQLLATYNLQQLQRHQPNQYLAVLITNAELIGKILVIEQKVTAGEDIMMTVTAKAK